MMRKTVRYLLLPGLLAFLVSCAGLARQNPPILPEARMTPGDVLPVTKTDICTPGYSKKVRNVPEAVKKQVYAAYGIRSHRPGEYEVDHLISLELGGSNSVRNLWPQSYRTQPWNARVKDKLENRLHSLVCSGKLDLRTAQQEIARNWIEAYKKYMGSAAPAAGRGRARRSRVRSSAPREIRSPGVPAGVPSAGGQVWVNTRSGKYFLPGSPYYGKTRQGTYMTEAEAKRRGYRAAR